MPVKYLKELLIRFFESESTGCWMTFLSNKMSLSIQATAKKP